MIDNVTTRHVVLNIGTDKPEKVKGLQIRPIKDNFYSVRGSVHKYKNKGLHNADDYYLSDFKNTLNQLFNEIGLNPDIAPLNGFEFGVNIKLPANPNNVLNRLILHKTETGNRKKEYKEFEYKNHSFKSYNKSGLTNIEPYHSENILRIEISVNRMEYIRKQKRIYLTRISDLLDVAVWEQLEQILIDTIQECLFIDFSTKEISRLSTKNHIKYLEYSNPLYWERLYTESRLNRNRYSRERAKCEAFIFQFSKSTLKTDIIKLISDKCSELRDIEKVNEVVKMWDKLTIIQETNKHEMWDKLTCNYEVKTYQSLSEKKIVGNGCGNITEKTKKGQLIPISSILSVPILFDLSDIVAPDKRLYKYRPQN